MNAADAMILAAGRGERMRPLTDRCPKPLLEVSGKPLMQWPLEALARGGFGDVLVNTAWLEDQIVARFGDILAAPTRAAATGSSADRAAGPTTSVSVSFSTEGRDFGGALETAGGIVRALPRLADPFWLVAGDVFVPDFRFTQLAMDKFRASGKLAHLWLVPNPEHNPNGDFALAEDGTVRNTGVMRHTYSTIGLYRHALFAPPYCAIAPGNPRGDKAPLAPILRAAIGDGRISGELYTGAWTDVGTPARLARLNEHPGFPLPSAPRP